MNVYMCVSVSGVSVWVNLGYMCVMLLQMCVSANVNVCVVLRIVYVCVVHVCLRLYE